MFEAQHWFGNGAGFRTGDPDDTDSTAAGRRGDGDDGVVEVHMSILTS